MKLAALAFAAFASIAAAQSFNESLRFELETYQVLDARTDLRGKVLPRKNALPAGTIVRVSAAGIASCESVWESELTLGEGGAAQFAIPVATLPGGYYTLTGKLGNESVPQSGPVFCVRQLRDGAPALHSLTKDDYLAFVVAAVKRLAEHQSLRLGNAPDGALFFTVTRPVYRSYRSIGYKRPDGTFENYWFPEAPMDFPPFAADFDLWTLLDRLSEATGDETYRDWVTGMADAFRRIGFDPKNGLGYFGVEAGLDARNAGVMSMKPGVEQAQFKPMNVGNDPRLPVDRMWKHAPDEMHRMCRAMFYGLITDPDSFDYNRFCHYNWNDADKKHALERNPAHCAFESVGARMIHWWAACFARMGDADCLGYAQRMADKWRTVQHAESGLVPDFFGAVASNPGAPMPPGEWVEVRGAALAAVAYLDAVAELRTRDGGEPLAKQLAAMAEKLALGVARHSYDGERKLFIEHLKLDGKPYESAARYTFHTQAEKDEAVKRDPKMAEVSVYMGTGLFRNPSYWEHCAGTSIVYELAEAARITKNAELIERCGRIVEDALAESRVQPGAFTEDGRWTFRASGHYIKAAIALHRATNEARYVDAAREFADREIARLNQVAYPDWWRMPERATLIDALLLLCEMAEK
ncbi:MAG: hypothetical protein HUU46_02100 [Candidatus Hydrogenedentes bacterium]|nr:hypothetical protein [Candidatus Hydrogenedentota bacterium]